LAELVDAPDLGSGIFGCASSSLAWGTNDRLSFIMNNAYYQKIFRRHEFKEVADYLMEHQQSLLDEFMDGFNSVEEAVNALSNPTIELATVSSVENFGSYLSQAKVNEEYMPNEKAWQSSFIKYENPDRGIHEPIKEFLKPRFLTGQKLLSEFGDQDCMIANYSSLGPHSTIKRHTGNENRSGEFVRVHIPLVVPDGDVYFEVAGEEIDWSDIFCFNNQYMHSAYNNTDQWRLCFLIDLRRTRIGLPEGTPFIEGSEENTPPYIRKSLPKVVKK
jgi:Aspartyl/Asparaginyl beta-hydroxylase